MMACSMCLELNLLIIIIKPRTFESGFAGDNELTFREFLLPAQQLLRAQYSIVVVQGV